MQSLEPTAATDAGRQLSSDSFPRKTLSPRERLDSEIQNLVRRGGYWKVRIKCEDGKMRFASTRCRDRDDAVRMLRETSTDSLIKAKALGIELTQKVVSQLQHGEIMSLEDLADDWEDWISQDYGLAPNSVRILRTRIDRFFSDTGIGKRFPTQLQPRDIQEYLHDPNLPNNVSGRYMVLKAIRSFCRWCLSNGFIQCDPTLMVKVRKHKLPPEAQKSRETKPFTKEDEQLILSRLKGPHLAMSIIAKHTGLRLSDVATLEWADIKPTGIEKLMIKTSKIVKVPFDGDNLPKLFRSMKVSNSKYLFPCEAAHVKLDRLSHLSNCYRMAIIRLGITGKSFNSWRHTYASRMMSEGKPIWFIRENLGHSELMTTLRYLHTLKGKGHSSINDVINEFDAMARKAVEERETSAADLEARLLQEQSVGP